MITYYEVIHFLYKINDKPPKDWLIKLIYVTILVIRWRLKDDNTLYNVVGVLIPFQRQNAPRRLPEFIHKQINCHTIPQVSIITSVTFVVK